MALGVDDGKLVEPEGVKEIAAHARDMQSADRTEFQSIEQSHHHGAAAIGSRAITNPDPDPDQKRCDKHHAEKHAATDLCADTRRRCAVAAGRFRLWLDRIVAQKLCPIER